VYQIDDHRFITLENYNSCGGDVWYNDTKQGVRTKVGETWPTGFLGKLVIDDPTGMNVVIPTVSTNLCGDRGCKSYAAYSTDGGRTFKWFQYDREHIGFDSVESSRLYKFFVLRDRLYVVHRWSESYGTDDNDAVRQYPLVPGIDLSKPYPEGIHGDGFDVSARPGYITGVRTPTGQDHYICDASIHDPKVLKR